MLSYKTNLKIANMNQVNFGKIITSIGLASLFTLLPLTSGSLQAQGEEGVRQGLPGNRISGGTRSGCTAGEKALTAIIPENNVWVTTAAYPQFYFYLPKAADAQEVEFVLRNEEDQQVYEKTFTMSGDAGIVSLSLLESDPLPALEKDKHYRWYLSVICNTQNRSQDLVVEGWIQRVDMNQNVTSRLDQTDPKTKANLYLEAGIWHEALNTLAQLRREQPQDNLVSNQWKQLLQSIGLEAMAQEPFLDLPNYD